MDVLNSLTFKEVKDDQEVADLSSFDIKAFTDTQDFSWSFDNIKKEVNVGWKLYSALSDSQIVAAILLKKSGEALLTKNTPIKISFQGNGFSHQIKSFYEDQARKKQLKKVINYCPADNFRMIALNESHGYHKTGKFFGSSNNIIEWEKAL